VASRATTHHKQVHHEEEGSMLITEVIWWAYTAFVALVALFLLVFAYKVRQKGE